MPLNLQSITDPKEPWRKAYKSAGKQDEVDRVFKKPKSKASKRESDRRPEPADANSGRDREPASAVDRKAAAKAYGASAANAAARRRKVVTAGQIMSSPAVTVSADAGLSRALQILRKNGFRRVPAVNRNGECVGILSERDILRVWESRGPLGPGRSASPGTELVRDIMSKKVMTAEPETDIRTVARMLVSDRAGCVPILDQSGNPAGVVTSTDVLRAVMTHPAFELWV